MKKHFEIRVKGIVQGVGFRPFVYRVAEKYSVAGTVINDTSGVLIHVEGRDPDLVKFIDELRNNAPALAYVMSVEYNEKPLRQYNNFSIGLSEMSSERMAFYSPDVALCDECKKDLFDSEDRRYHYPFTTCINCGPRFSIIDDIPYDRKNTAMEPFPMCKDCEAEYRDPDDRRFHSQPNACPLCGPRMSLYDKSGKLLFSEIEDVALETLKFLKSGKIVAIKGIGGYHLAVDARNDNAVLELRKRKERPFKPFAMMVQTIEEAEKFLNITVVEKELLLSRERPILLLKEKRADVSRHVSPGLSFQGVMLPYTPFHEHIFSMDSGLVLVMTSGNLSDEPIEYQDENLYSRLGNIADYFVSYNREITGQSDDSVLHVVDEKPYFIRRSRGYVPVPLLTRMSTPNILAMGGDLKNSFAIARKDFTILSQYLGDMADPLTFDVFQDSVRHYVKIFDSEPDVIVSDLHPGYMTRRFADEMAGSDKTRIEVQHHHAHIASVLEEQDIDGPVLGIAFDGTGYGPDGTLWGSEFLIAERSGYKRAAHFSNFHLPGGETAIRDVWKTGLSLLYGKYGPRLPATAIDKGDAAGLVIQMIERNINSPLTCSIGRIFDGVSAILGIAETVSSEAEAAILLEEAAHRSGFDGDPYIIPFIDGDIIKIETEELIGYIVSSMDRGMEINDIARAFHNAIIHTALAVAVKLRDKTGIGRAALSGGVFHNRILLGGLMKKLAAAGFEVLVNKEAPCNDGCIALGQVAVAREQLNREDGKIT